MSLQTDREPVEVKCEWVWERVTHYEETANGWLTYVGRGGDPDNPMHIKKASPYHWRKVKRES